MMGVGAWIKIGAVVLAASAFFFGGYKYAAALYQADIDQLKAGHALALAEKEKEYRANERKQIEAISQAWEDYDKTMAELAESRADRASLRVELERVRNLADGYRARLSEASANPCKHISERLARCVGLLEEGAGLATEGAELSQRVNSKKDAVVRIHSVQ